MSGFVAGVLEDDDREAELEDDLGGHQAAEGVVVALLGGVQVAGDERQRSQPGKAGPAARQQREADGFVQADEMPKAGYQGARALLLD